MGVVMWKSKDSLQELVLSFYRAGGKDWIQTGLQAWRQVALLLSLLTSPEVELLSQNRCKLLGSGGTHI